ncbi:hypothetical protein ACFPRL_17105 [Pseudoclavibacter helvolus]
MAASTLRCAVMSASGSVAPLDKSLRSPAGPAARVSNSENRCARRAEPRVTPTASRCMAAADAVAPKNSMPRAASRKSATTSRASGATCASPCMRSG